MRSFSGQIIQIIPFVQEELRTGERAFACYRGLERGNGIKKED